MGATNTINSVNGKTGTPNQQSITMPFQYGYGDMYEHMAGKALHDAGLITLADHESLRRYCEANKIILRRSIQTGCKKSDLKNISI